jgi:hypothetical protein
VKLDWEKDDFQPNQEKERLEIKPSSISFYDQEINGRCYMQELRTYIKLRNRLWVWLCCSCVGSLREEEENVILLLCEWNEWSVFEWWFSYMASCEKFQLCPSLNSLFNLFTLFQLSSKFSSN